MKLIMIIKFYRDETGGSAVEYSIMLAGIAIAIISAVNNFGSSVKYFFVKGSDIFTK